MWQERLLIVTEKRLFIIIKKSNDIKGGTSSVSEVQLQAKVTDKILDKDLEIVDSIPMEEIVSVEVGSTNGLWSEEIVPGKST